MRVADSEELRVKLDKHRHLLTASIEITRRCNMRCVHCLRDLDNDDGLPYAVVCDVLEQLVTLGCMTLTLTGGEPLVRRDLLDILRYAWAKRLSVTIMSNGTLMTSEVAAEMKRLHVSEIQFSLYAADGGVHDAVTQAPGSYERTLRAITLAKEHGLRVRISTPLLQINADQAPGVEALCGQLGVTFVPGALIFPKNNGDRRPLNLLASTMQMAGVIRKESSGECDHMTPAQPEGPALPLCSAGRDRLGIAADGAIYPCDAWRIAIGNVHSDRLADVWRTSQRLADVRATLRRHPAECSGCSARGQCAWCPGLSHELFGDGVLPNAQDCRRTRLSFGSPESDDPGWTVPVHLQQG